ncbi:MAG TPA: prephenate dehydrogenase/arogenate dehydrogenase family protein [Candidatus Limnocylindrales bacterium]
MRIALLGVGLIGGSIARALRSGDGAMGPIERIAAWSPTGAGPRAALEAGVVDAAATGLDEAVGGADLVVLAAPPIACIDLIRLLGDLRERLAPNCVVTDVASTKARVIEAAVEVGLPFVGGHPMAGAEATGFGASRADLFHDHPWVVVATETSPRGGVDRVEALATACGARPLRLDAATHDRAVAAISHVPLVLAAALVEAVVGSPDGPARPDRALEAQLASSGWASKTRLALGSPEMGGGIAATNAPAIAAGLRDVRTVIDAWIAELEAEDVALAPLVERFRAARDRLTRSDGEPG